MLNGGTIRNAGTFQLCNRNDVNIGTFTLAGGTLLRDQAGTTNLSNANGASWKNVNYVSPGDTTVLASTGTIAMNTLTRNAGGTMNFLPSGGVITIANSNTNSILGGWATTGSDWAVGNGTAANITAYGGYQTFNLSGTSDSYNSMQTDGGTLAASGTTNSLKIITTQAGQALNLSGNTLTLSSGGLLFAGSNNYAIQSGQLGASGAELIVQQQGSGVLTVNSPISSGSGSLTKAGSGILALGGTNNFSGPTIVAAGVLQVAGSNLSAASNLRLVGGLLETNGAYSVTMGTAVGQAQLPYGASGFSAAGGSLTVSLGTANLAWGSASFSPNPLILNGPGADGSNLSFQSPIDLTGGTANLVINRFIEVDVGTATLNGAVSNSGVGSMGVLVKTGTGTLVLANTANSYAAGTRVSAGILNIASDAVLGAVPSPANVNLTLDPGGTLQAAAGLTLNAARNLIVNAGSSGHG